MAESIPISQRVSSVPARTLREAYLICDPGLPLHPEVDAALYVDVDALRGRQHREEILKGIRWAGAGTSTRWFLGGHPGTGKTSEILRLQHDLEQAVTEDVPTSSGVERRVVQDKALVVFVDAQPLLEGAVDVDLAEILWSSGHAWTNSTLPQPSAFWEHTGKTRSSDRSRRW